jgi:hypothetical protein
VFKACHRFLHVTRSTHTTPIDPKEYYPEGYHPELLEDWPVDDDLVVPVEALPVNLKDSMGAQWRLTELTADMTSQIELTFSVHLFATGTKL